MSAQNKSVFVEAGSKGILSILSTWLEDKDVSEIMINNPYEVFIEKKGQMSRFDVPELSPLYIKRMFTFIANEANQILDESRPLLSANLYDNSRVQLAIPPASKHYTLSIRRQTVVDMTLEDYKKTSFFDYAKPFYLSEHDNVLLDDNEKELLALYNARNWWDFLIMAIANKKNIVIAGATSSGKTTFLNACLKKIPLNERIITLEDTFELKPPHPNQVRLFAPKKNNESDIGVSMQSLLQCSLRLRPDRIFMGEIRGGEIMDFIDACSTGHEGSITCIHASNPKIAFMRMVGLYKKNNVPSMTDEDIMRELTAVIDIVIETKFYRGERIMSDVYFKTAEELFNAKTN